MHFTANLGLELINCVSETKNGLGIQIWNVPLDKYMKFLKVCLM